MLNQQHQASEARRHERAVSSSFLRSRIVLGTALISALLLFSCQGDLGGKKNGGEGGSGAISGTGGASGGEGGCLAQCTGRECGDDGCGGICGTCADGIACNPQAGICAVLCGNGALDPGETCDPPGSCVSTCPDDGDACTAESLVGTAASCSAACESAPVTECTPGDGCCAPGCNAVTDSDCEPVCGNAVSEPGELCGDGGAVCPIECDDGDLCTEDALMGSAETCDAVCEFTPIDPCALDQARGVTVGDISVDQGIRIPVREEGALLAVDDRNGPLIVERPMLVRADWQLDDAASFVAREIRAVLTIKYEDQTTETVEDIKETGNRTEFSYDDFRDAYVFLLSKEQVRKGMELSIELFEVDESYRMQPAPVTPSRFPQDPESTFDLGVNTDPSHLEVVLVPFYHDLGANCPPAPDLNSMTNRGGETVPEHEYYRRRLISQNPVSDATVTVHDVVSFTGSAESSGDMFTALRQVREADDADDWQFYYGIIEPCDDGPSFSGVASVPGHGDDGLPDKNDGSRRTGWGDYRDDGRHAGTFVHEVGHEQGRRHVVCGGASGPDPDYPNDTGDIDVYGWDVFSVDTIHPPDHKDYMSYCGPSWVSEYAWNLMEPWIAEMSRWPSEQMLTTEAPTPMLYATIQPGKAGQWWTGELKGAPDFEPSNHSLAFYSNGRLLGTVTAEYEEVHKQPGAYFLSAPLPEGWDKVTHVVHNDGASLQEVERSSVVAVR